VLIIAECEVRESICEHKKGSILGEEDDDEVIPKASSKTRLSHDSGFNYYGKCIFVGGTIEMMKVSQRKKHASVK